jgi:hypothetical protein
VGLTQGRVAKAEERGLGYWILIRSVTGLAGEEAGEAPYSAGFSSAMLTVFRPTISGVRKSAAGTWWFHPQRSADPA